MGFMCSRDTIYLTIECTLYHHQDPSVIGIIHSLLSIYLFSTASMTPYRNANESLHIVLHSVSAFDCTVYTAVHSNCII